MRSVVIMEPESICEDTVSTAEFAEGKFTGERTYLDSFLEVKCFCNVVLLMLRQQFAHMHHRCSDICSAVCALNHQWVLITKGASKKQNKKQTCYIFFPTLFFTKDFIKQIYDALSLSAFPLFHGSVASHCRQGEVFSRCSLVAASPSQQHFHSYTGRSFSAPFKITHCHRHWKAALPGRD